MEVEWKWVKVRGPGGMVAEADGGILAYRCNSQVPLWVGGVVCTWQGRAAVDSLDVALEVGSLR